MRGLLSTEVAEEERVVVVTGGATGLGAALVERFASKGFRVLLNYHRNGNAKALAKSLHSTSEGKL